MDWFLIVMKKYAVFSGRARRAEYWYFFLFYIVFMIGLSFIDGVAGLMDEETGVGVLSTLFLLATLIPSIAVGVRRLHDTDRSGWWYLISFIPLIGTIVLFIFFVLDGTPGDNTYGPNPKAAAP